MQADDRSYRVLVGDGAYGDLGRLLPAPAAGTACAVVTTDRIAPLYGEPVVAALREGGWSPALLIVPDGERTKTLQTASGLYDRLVDAGVDGAGAVFALGGGVVGDLAGFVAATYRRGVRSRNCPPASGRWTRCVAARTTPGRIRWHLLPTSAVVIDSGRWPRCRSASFGVPAEVIKHAHDDPEMFGCYPRASTEFAALQSPMYVLARNCQISRTVRCRDPYTGASVRA